MSTPMLTLPGLPLGLSARPVRYAGDGLHDADLAALLHVAHRCEQAAIGVADTTAAEVVEMLTGPTVAREQSLLVVDEAGRPVGAGWYDVDESERGVFCESYADPGRADSAAVMQALVTHGTQVAQTAIAGRADWHVRTGLLAQETEHAKVVLANGYRTVRRFWRMEIRSDSPAIPATAPTLPPGVTFQPGGDDAHLRAVYEVDQASFADHWGFAPRTYDESWAHLRAEPGARPEYWGLLRVAGEPAGICLRSDSRLELGFAYVSVLGVRREHRRRGLAALMLRHTFVQARDEGLVGTALHVDSENPTGATRLYESVGMTPAQVYDTFELATP